MPTDGPSWAVSPIEWGAQVNYDAWTDTYTPDDGVALHHGGGTNYSAGNAPFTEGKEIALLRSWEDYHLSLGWRGLAYGWALGQTGKVYRGRGWSTYGAHTGDVDGDGIANNVEVIPIVFLGSGNHHELSDQASSSLILLRRYLEEVSGRELKLYGHQELKGTVTTCPGPKLMNYVVNNRFLEDDVALTPAEQSALTTLVAMLGSRATDAPPWGATSWTEYLDEVWTGPTTSDPGPINPVTHVQLAKIYSIIRYLISQVSGPGTDTDTVVAEIIARLEE